MIFSVPNNFDRSANTIGFIVHSPVFFYPPPPKLKKQKIASFNSYESKFLHWPLRQFTASGPSRPLVVTHSIKELLHFKKRKEKPSQFEEVGEGLGWGPNYPSSNQTPHRWTGWTRAWYKSLLTYRAKIKKGRKMYQWIQ